MENNACMNAHYLDVSEECHKNVKTPVFQLYMTLKLHCLNSLNHHSIIPSMNKSLHQHLLLTNSELSLTKIIPLEQRIQ